jgi:SAM-dependent methyltransferase
MTDQMLLDTRRAFDDVAADYDGPSGNNEIVQYMRERLRRAVLANAPAGSRLLDLGCGTGLDAAYFAERGYEVVGIDSSPLMIERSRDRLRAAGLTGRTEFYVLGIEEIALLRWSAFDLIYSDLGPLNCALAPTWVSRDCAGLLRFGGHLVVSLIGRWCPWELGYYGCQGRLERAGLRFQRSFRPVQLGTGSVWTRYYTPAELSMAFQTEFIVRHWRALGLVVPPPYLIGAYRRLGPLRAALSAIEDRIADWPVARDLGDHFLMVLDRRDRSEHPR